MTGRAGAVAVRAFVARHGGRIVAELRRRWVAFGVLWRRSLQVRVVVSTLALSSAVVFVLGMVLQNEITDRLLAAKVAAATSQAQSAQQTASTVLRGVNSGSDDLQTRMANALSSLTSSATDPQQEASSAAGGFVPVLANDDADQPPDQLVFSGPYADVPSALRQAVEGGRVEYQINTVPSTAGNTTFLVLGVPITSAGQPMQLYLLFPLTAEQQTISVVQDTLVVGGLVLVLLLASVTNLVIRQVVRPVRRAAEVAERFAEGHLDERMRVIGEDDVARLAESYNQMAESIQDQIHQLEEFGQLQRRFSSDVSHELRTPLTTVRMAADVLHASREQFPSGLARSTELLVDELDRFEALLGDLLEISKLDAGVEDLASDLVDVAGLARSAIASVQGIVGGTTTVIELHLPEGPDPSISDVTAEVDARRVERILRNLLANAIDHGEGLPVRVTVAGDDDAVAVTVRDYGVGLRAGEGELVFNRFWRADPSRNRRTGGTGLGLAISLEDARLHSGWLDAWGEPGQGASFRLTLPRRPNTELTDSPLPLNPPDAQAPVEAAEAPTVSATQNATGTAVVGLVSANAEVYAVPSAPEGPAPTSWLGKDAADYGADEDTVGANGLDRAEGAEGTYTAAATTRVDRADTADDTVSDRQDQRGTSTESAGLSVPAARTEDRS
ncbi:MAG TPA: MtrAB system histidine kinase MtrB [Pseudonocardiaceae bacterium]|nr:MtrAB system histidine kinase MtrB [Pseudonocardiaceae bacterium]